MVKDLAQQAAVSSEEEPLNVALARCGIPIKKKFNSYQSKIVSYQHNLFSFQKTISKNYSSLCPGPLVHWSLRPCGPFLWSLGPLVPWSSGPWSSGPGLRVLGSVLSRQDALRVSWKSPGHTSCEGRLCITRRSSHPTVNLDEEGCIPRWQTLCEPREGKILKRKGRFQRSRLFVSLAGANFRRISCHSNVAGLCFVSNPGVEFREGRC